MAKGPRGPQAGCTWLALVAFVLQLHHACRLLMVAATCGGGGMSPQQSMPCPLPPWRPTWNMTLSTFIMPGRSEGMLTEGPANMWEHVRRFGLIDVE